VVKPEGSTGHDPIEGRMLTSPQDGERWMSGDTQKKIWSIMNPERGEEDEFEEV